MVHVKRLVIGLALAGAVVMTAGCGAGEDEPSTSAATAGGESTPVPDGEAGTIAEVCGDEKISVALADGAGSNTWRKIGRAEFEDEASKCPNVERVLYTDAQGNSQKASSDINSLVAQGVDVITVLADFGPAQLPAIRKAHQAGVKVVPYVINPGGSPGTDYETFVGYDQAETGKRWGAWAAEQAKALGKSKVVFLGGIPGNPSSLAFLEGVQDGLAGTGVTLTSSKPIDTNWDPGQAQRAMSGVLANRDDIGAVITDYGATAYGAIRAFQNANRPLVPIATIDENRVSCAFLDLEEENPDFELFTTSAGVAVSRLALRKGVAAAQGIESPESPIYPTTVLEDTTAGKEPRCDPSLPPDAPLSSTLTKEQLKNLF